MVTLGSIPNPIVKRRSADDNASERGCESRSSPAQSVELELKYEYY